MSRAVRPARARVPRRPVLPLLAALLLAACAQPRPPMADPPVLPQRYASGPDAVSPVLEADWWKRLGEPELDGLVDRALAANLDLRLAAARVEEASVAVSLARAAQWPSLDFGAGVTHARASTLGAQPVVDATSVSHRAALSTSFEIDLWGRLRDADRAAGQQLLATQFARDTLRLALVGALVQAWLGVRTLDLQRAALEGQKQLRRESLALVRRRFAGGIASRLEVAQAEGTLSALASQALELERQRALLVHQLGQLAGDPGLGLPVDTRPLPAPLIVPAGLPSELLLRRPDLQQAEATMRAAFAQFEVTKKSAWPTLALTASLGAQSADLLDLVKAGARIWSIGPQLLLSVFDAGRNEARSDEARSRAEQAVIGWQRAAQIAFREVSDALVSVDRLAAQEADFGRQREAAAEAQRIATRRHAAGYSGYLEVLDAQRSLIDTELASLRLRQSRLDAGVALMKALGGGWQARR